MLVLGDDCLLTTASGHRNGNGLVVEVPTVLGVNGPFVRSHRVSVLLVAGDRVLPAQVLSGLDHAAFHRKVDSAGVRARFGQSVVELDGRALCAPTHVGGVELGSAHALGAAGDDQITHPGLYLHRGVDDRLQSRTATAIELYSGNGHVETGVECRDSSDGRGLSVGVPPDRR